MDISLKYKILEKIIQSTDDILLGEIHTLLGLSEGDFWDNLPPEVKKSIEESEKEHDQGLGVEHSKVMETIKRRYLND